VSAASDVTGGLSTYPIVLILLDVFSPWRDGERQQRNSRTAASAPTIIIGMHPIVRHDLPRFGQLDHVDGRRIEASAPANIRRGRQLRLQTLIGWTVIVAGALITFAGMGFIATEAIIWFETGRVVTIGKDMFWMAFPLSIIATLGGVFIALAGAYIVNRE
jgi:hypothetical protein